MLGDIEIRKADWLKIRNQGPLRFVASCCRSSISGRIGALLMLCSLEGVHGFRAIDGSAWFLLFLGAFDVSLSLLYGWRAWLRMEKTFYAAARCCPWRAEYGRPACTQSGPRAAPAQPRGRSSRHRRGSWHGSRASSVSDIHQCQTSEGSAAKFKELLEEFYSDSPEGLMASLFGLTLVVKKPNSDQEQD